MISMFFKCCLSVKHCVELLSHGYFMTASKRIAERQNRTGKSGKIFYEKNEVRYSINEVRYSMKKIR